MSVAERARRAAQAIKGEADPGMVRWVEELERHGWTVAATGRGYLRLRWPKAFAAITGSPASLYVPLVRDTPDFAEMYGAMSRALGAICWMGAAIRVAEQHVHVAAVDNGWERERPVRWPTTENFQPQLPDGVTRAASAPGS